jgi:1-deoxy-D-xylulose-5-phosphate synthase
MLLDDPQAIPDKLSDAGADAKLNDSSILRKIKTPTDVAALDECELPLLAGELRGRIIEVVSRNGGHLASPLGVVELTIALLRVFDPAKDKIIWDVGHQAYPYKLLTGRNGRFDSLRQLGGVSGFPKMSESRFDHFGVGHASTSVSAALGMAVARNHKGGPGADDHVLAVVGDGALTGGMIYEAMNHAGGLEKPLIVIFNDNEMSISKNVGALSYFLSRNLSARWVRRVKKEVGEFLKAIPGVGADMFEMARRSRKSVKSFFTPGILFEALGFDYIGPVQGHDFASLEQALRVAETCDRPVLVHVYTQKGKGYKPAESNPANFHGIGCFNPNTGDMEAPPPSGVCASGHNYTRVFADALCELAAVDEKILAISAAMPDGTGLSRFAEKFPERFHDVGICEQHAVTFAAGLATQGFKPVVAVYSTFMQRAYDQVVHDVCLQNLPVVLALDRAGLVGEDGPTHHGVFDISCLRHVPNLNLLAPRDSVTLRECLAAALALNAPAALRYPRGVCPDRIAPLEPARSILEDYRQDGRARGQLLLAGDAPLAVVAVGNAVLPAHEALLALRGRAGVKIALFDPVWLKPLPEQGLLALAEKYSKLLIVEEQALPGGFGSAVLEFLNDHALLSRCRVVRHGLPDRFIEHGKQAHLRAELELDAAGLKKKVLELLA